MMASALKNKVQHQKSSICNNINNNNSLTTTTTKEQK